MHLFQIKLMDIPIQIIERYKSFRKDCHLFHIGDHGTINKHIKRVAAMCGIKKQVSFHVSRHSWAVSRLITDLVRLTRQTNSSQQKRKLTTVWIIQS